MTTHTFRALLAAALVLAAGPAAAQRVGPVDAAHGYPAWYQDKSGLTLEFCQPSNQAELDGGWCLLLPGDTTVPERFPDPFADEHFYFAAGANIPFTAGGITSRALLTLALEAAFAQGPVVAGDQVVFGRVRIKIDSVPFTGTYTVIHPYGTEVFELAAGERLFYTEDIGFGCGRDFDCALNSRVLPFLLASNAPGGPELPPVAGPVAGKLYIAAPERVGPVTGSPNNQNTFTVVGPGGWSISTNDFSLMGRVYTGAIPGRVTINRASYSSVPNAAGGSDNKLDVFATAHPTTQGRLPGGPAAQVVLPVLAFYPAACLVTATGALDEPEGIPGVQMYNAGPQYYGQSQPASIPPAICVEDYTARDINGQVVPLFTQGTVKDLVTVTEASFTPQNGGSLTVKAVSSDQVSNPPPLLKALGGTLTNGVLTIAPLAAPPPSVRVTSDKGGEAELAVTTGAGTYGGGGIPIAGNDEIQLDEDSAGVLIPVLVNDTVDGSPVDPAKATINLVVNSRLGTATVVNGQVEYTPFPNAWGSEGIGYTLTVDGKTSPAAYVTIIIVNTNDAPTAVADTAAGVAGQPISINLLANDTDVDGGADLTGVTELSAVSPATGVTLTQGTGGTVTFTATQGGTYTFTYRAADAAGAASANVATVTVTISATETLTITRAQFVRNSLRWRVDGTSSLRAGQAVTITYDNGTLLNGTPLVGTVIGYAVVDALGAWTLDTVVPSNSMLNPNASNTFGTRPTRVRARSALGGTITAAISLK